jgi:hypothetical protein
MTVTQFLVALALGAGAIALWINNRFPGLAPGRMVVAFIHVGIAMVIGMALVPAIDAVVEASVSPLMRAIVITFLVGLPALIYALLTSIWIIVIAQSAMKMRR